MCDSDIRGVLRVTCCVVYAMCVLCVMYVCIMNAACCVLCI